jgi:hypothetical protein
VRSTFSCIGAHTAACRASQATLARPVVVSMLPRTGSWIQ